MAKVKKAHRSNLVKLAVCVFVFYVVYMLLQQQLAIRERKVELERAQQSCEEQRLANKELERLLSLEGAPDYFERLAKDKYGYAYFDERVFIDTSGK